MKVKELINILKEMPQEALVVMSKDAEGNSYSPLYKVASDTIYEPETTWYGEVYSTKWSAEDVDMEENAWKEFKKRCEACVVLIPTN